GDSVFPCLKRLDIEGCPNLFEFSFKRDEVLLCLQELCIRDCPNLVEVSLKAPLLSPRDLTVSKCSDGLLRSLVHVGLPNEVWKGVILDLKAVENWKSCVVMKYDICGNQKKQRQVARFL
nr:hypothetical protein [Tanacetum cinerariifolium]